ncbi:plasmid mobilization protein (plasmid) [Macrococcoides bohemicum]|uniref:plasmid mobilization protein n=1 Tax=Macrococcoides bohemicum TaxID=1903056 RepID=UPI003B00B6C0
MTNGHEIFFTEWRDEQVSETKKKSKIISFRVNADEYDVIAGTASSANLNITSYLKARALGGKIHRPLMKSEDIQSILPPLSKLSGEIGRVGNNMNQSTRALKVLSREPFLGQHEMNEVKKLTEEFNALKQEFEKLQSEVHQIWHKLK